MLLRDVPPLPPVDAVPAARCDDALSTFRVAAGDVVIRGTCGGGIDHIRISGRAVAPPLGPGEASVIGTLVTPYSLERRLRVGDAVVVERVLATLRPAAVVIQWTTDAPVELYDRRDDAPALRLEAGGTATWLAGADVATDPAALAAGVRRAAADLDRARRGGLRVTGFGDAPDWARARLALAGAPPDNPAARLAAGTAWLAMGRHDRAGIMTDEPAADAVQLLLLARSIAWSGDQALLAARWDATRAAVRHLLGSGGDAGPFLPAALAALETTATDAGDPAFAAELRAARRRLADPPAAPTAVRAALDDGRLHDAAAGWQRMLREALPIGDAVSADAGFAADAHLIATLAHGVLGLDPDAARHRLRFAPRIMPAWPAVAIDDVRFADGSIAAEIHVDGPAIDIRVRQVDGAIPYTLILEPVVGSSRVAGCLVDGRTADLSLRRLDAATVVPVQLVLDADRRLEIVLDPDHGT